MNEELTASGRHILSESPEQIEARWFDICFRVLGDREFFTSCDSHLMGSNFPGVEAAKRKPLATMSVMVQWPIDEPALDNLAKQVYPLPVPRTVEFWEWVERSLTEKVVGKGEAA